MFRKKTKDYSAAIRDALAQQDHAKAEKLAIDAFETSTTPEGVLAWICGAFYESGLPAHARLIALFVERFPDSLYPVRVFYGDLYARSGNMDVATAQSRRYLRLIRDSGTFPTLGDTALLRDGVGRAFLLLTAAYTELGSRSYSRKALEFGLALAIAEHWRSPLQRELKRLGDELSVPELAAIDDKWVQFYDHGARGIELVELCRTKEFPLHAERVELIESKFRYNRHFACGEDELFLLVARSGGSLTFV